MLFSHGELGKDLIMLHLWSTQNIQTLYQEPLTTNNDSWLNKKYHINYIILNNTVYSNILIRKISKY